MSVKAKLIVDDKAINLLSFEFSFNQGINALGKPSGKVVFLGLRLVIEAQKDLDFSEWAVAENQTRQIELHIYPVIMGGRTHKFCFYDCHLLQWVNNFSSTGDKPTSELLHISAAGVKDSFFDTEYSAHWRKTFPQEEAEPTTLNNEPEIRKYHIEDLDGNELSKDKIKVGEEIILIIESNNATGETFEFDLDNQRLDYEHNGVKLKNDILEVQITNDIQQVPLKAISQEN